MVKQNWHMKYVLRSPCLTWKNLEREREREREREVKKSVKILPFVCERKRGPSGRVPSRWMRGWDSQLGGELLTEGGAPQVLDLWGEENCFQDQGPHK
eukprot:350628-Chlamydomonas_euryale.AAC.5